MRRLLVRIQFWEPKREQKETRVNEIGIIYEDAILLPLEVKKKRPRRKGTRSLKRAKERLTRMFKLNGGVFCFYCRKPIEGKEITGDHVHPVSKDGVSNCSNVVLSCYDCNMNKGDKQVELSEDQKKILEWQKTLVGRNKVLSVPPITWADSSTGRASDS